MAWIELHEQFSRHPKVNALARQLGVKPVQARGHVVTLWLWAAAYAQDGDLTRFGPEEIADAVDWEEDPKKVVDALVASGWLDRDGEQLTIHDWNDHGLRLLRSMRERQKNHREKPKDAGDSHNGSEEVSRDSHVTVTLPSRPTDLTDLTEPTDQQQQQAPPVELERTQDLEQYLLAMWGREGRLGHLMLREMVMLAKKHGMGKLKHAIDEAARHNARNTAYVKGILEPKPGARPPTGRGAVVDTTAEAFLERQRRRADRDPPADPRVAALLDGMAGTKAAGGKPFTCPHCGKIHSPAFVCQERALALAEGSVA